MDGIKPELQAKIDREVLIKNCAEKVKTQKRKSRCEARIKAEELKHLMELEKLEQDFIDG